MLNRIHIQAAEKEGDREEIIQDVSEVADAHVAGNRIPILLGAGLHQPNGQVVKPLQGWAAACTLLENIPVRLGKGLMHGKNSLGQDVHLSLSKPQFSSLSCPPRFCGCKSGSDLFFCCIAVLHVPVKAMDHSCPWLIRSGQLNSDSRPGSR